MLPSLLSAAQHDVVSPRAVIASPPSPTGTLFVASMAATDYDVHPAPLEVRHRHSNPPFGAFRACFAVPSASIPPPLSVPFRPHHARRDLADGATACPTRAAGGAPPIAPPPAAVPPHGAARRGLPSVRLWGRGCACPGRERSRTAVARATIRFGHDAVLLGLTVCDCVVIVGRGVGFLWALVLHSHLRTTCERAVDGRTPLGRPCDVAIRRRESATTKEGQQVRATPLPIHCARQARHRPSCARLICADMHGAHCGAHVEHIPSGCGWLRGAE